MKNCRSEYLYRVFIQLSIFCNVLLGGHSNQTFSARNYQRKKDGKVNLVWCIDLLLKEDHCMMCWVNWQIIHLALTEKGFRI